MKHGWVRLAVALMMALAVCSAAFADTAGATGTAGDADAPPRVLVVTLPRLTWDRLSQVDTPVIDDFVKDASLASLSIRTIGSLTSPGDAYLTIGAGIRTTATNLEGNGNVLMSTETADGGSAAEVFARRTGLEPSGRLLALDFPEVARRNHQLLYGSEPGLLGTTMRKAAEQSDDVGDIAAIGNADTTMIDADSRHVGLAAVDENGEAPHGDVGQGLLLSDPTAAFGVRMDPATATAATTRAWDEGTQVLFFEMSDLERAELARLESSTTQGDEQYDDALELADAMLANLLAEMRPERDLVLLVAPTAPEGDRDQLTVFAARGPGFDAGWAQSAATRRAGYVGLTDIASTVLRSIDVDVPDDMGDTPITHVADSGSVSERVDALITANERAQFRDKAVGPLTVAFIVLLVVMLAMVAWGVARRWRHCEPLVIAALVVMSVPPASYLGGLLPYGGLSVGTYGLALLAIAAVIAALCRLIGATVGGGDPLVPPVMVAGIIVVVLVVDVVTGGNLQINTIFGYSPIVAGRFAGYGNQAFSLVAVAALLVATGAWQLSETRRPEARTSRLVGVILLFLVVIVVDGAPSWGSDVGGVLASVPAFTVCVLLLAGRRIRVRTVVLIGVVTVAIISAFAALDMARPAESRTHLGRFAARLLDGEGGVILSRKLTANLSVLTSTVWALVIPAALLFFVYLTWRPNSLLKRINAQWPTFPTFGVSAITLGLVAWALNDSGVSMPAMMLAVAMPYTALLVLALDPEEPGAPVEPIRSEVRDGSADPVGSVGEP